MSTLFFNAFIFKLKVLVLCISNYCTGVTKCLEFMGRLGGS